MTVYTVRQSLLLFLTAVIWGVAFVAQSAGMEHLGPFTYNSVRSLLGGLGSISWYGYEGGRSFWRYHIFLYRKKHIGTDRKRLL